ncbi:MAG: Hpt domain-containing protein [Phycisphaeraceae bacterium]
MQADRNRSGDGRLHRLIHNDEQHRKLVEVLDAKAAAPSGDDKRRYPRFSYITSHGLPLQIKHPGGGWVSYLVRPRNLGRDGIGFFHGGFLHRGSFCVVELHGRNGDVADISGHVVHCRHIAAGLHEVGVRFISPIDLRPFVELPEGVAGHDTSGAPEFAGQVLCLDGTAVDRSLFRFEASEAGVEVVEVEDAPEAIDLVRTGTFKLVVVGDELLTLSCDEFIQGLRNEGYQGPIVRWTVAPDKVGEGVETLPKPFAVEDLLRLFRKHLLAGEPEAEVIESRLWRIPRTRPLVLAYLENLHQQAGQLEQALAEWDPALVSSLASQIKGSAASYGYPTITEKADVLLQALGRESGEAREALRTLLDECRAACRFRSSPFSDSRAASA